MLRVCRANSKIYLRDLIGKQERKELRGSTVPTQKWFPGKNDDISVVFQIPSRDPSSWEPFFAPEVSSYRPILIYTLKDGEEKDKWQQFAEEILEIARKNLPILDNKIGMLLNARYRKQRNYKNISEYTFASHTSYQNVCWRCHESVDSESELGHKKCGWLICHSCGACGCGYKAGR